MGSGRRYLIVKSSTEAVVTENVIIMTQHNSLSYLVWRPGADFLLRGGFFLCLFLWKRMWLDQERGGWFLHLCPRLTYFKSNFSDWNFLMSVLWTYPPVSPPSPHNLSELGKEHCREINAVSRHMQSMMTFVIPVIYHHVKGLQSVMALMSGTRIEPGIFCW